MSTLLLFQTPIRQNVKSMSENTNYALQMFFNSPNQKCRSQKQALFCLTVRRTKQASPTQKLPCSLSGTGTSSIFSILQIWSPAFFPACSNSLWQTAMAECSELSRCVELRVWCETQLPVRTESIVAVSNTLLESSECLWVCSTNIQPKRDRGMEKKRRVSEGNRATDSLCLKPHFHERGNAVNAM